MEMKKHKEKMRSFDEREMEKRWKRAFATKKEGCDCSNFGEGEREGAKGVVFLVGIRRMVGKCV
jgi:hypothetical protein